MNNGYNNSRIHDFFIINGTCFGKQVSYSKKIKEKKITHA